MGGPSAEFTANLDLLAPSGTIVSFGALMFPGDLSGGVPVAIWAMLIGSCVGGIWIALSTSLPPLATSIDSPTGAALVLLSALTASDVRAAGGSLEAAVQSVMLVFTMATLLSGAVLYCLGICRWGSYFRFVPYPVVGGFLAATGYFLIAGAVGMTSGPTALTFAGLASWKAVDAERLAAAALVLGVMVGLPALRLKGLYLAVSTLAAHFVIIVGVGQYQSAISYGAGFIRGQTTLFHDSLVQLRVLTPANGAVRAVAPPDNAKRPEPLDLGCRRAAPLWRNPRR